MANRERTNQIILKVILTGLMMAMITVVTMIIPIPIPFTSGYIHLGDAVIFLSILILGWKYGAVSAGVGSALADIFVGFTVWAPWTLCIKGGMAVIMGIFIEKSLKRKGKNILGVPVYQQIGMIFAGLFMVIGYYIAEGVIYGNFIAATLAIPWNIGQFTVGLVIASLISSKLYKSPAKKFFTYKPNEIEKSE